MNRVEATLLITAACLPTLRPVFLFITGRDKKMDSRSDRLERIHDYQLQSLSKASGNKILPSGLYQMKTAGTGELDSMQILILPPNAILKTMDVNVDYKRRSQLAQNSTTPRTGKYEWAFTGKDRWLAHPYEEC